MPVVRAMKIDSPLPTYIAYEVGYFTDGDLIEWAIEYLSNSEYYSDDPDLIELMSINTKVKSEVEKAGTCTMHVTGLNQKHCLLIVGIWKRKL